MSSTASSTNEDRATEFAAAVRERLSDLPVEEVDDLLDGLQADLADRLADGEELGDPAAYADELRQAAGLPERGARAGRKRRTPSEWADATGAGLRRWADASPGRRSVRDFLVSLRPVWWVARGVALPFGVLGLVTFVTGAWWWFYPDRSLESFPFVVFTLGCVILSIQWGRGKWAPQRWMVWVRRAASVLAAIALIPVMGIAWGKITTIQTEYVDSGNPYMGGLSYEGTEIGNIFAYDCNGQPLDGVQLFTRDGQPLTTLQGGEPPFFQEESFGDDGEFLGDFFYRYAKNPLATLPNGWSGWNVFPLQVREEVDGSQTAAEPKAAKAPFAQVPAVSAECPAPGAEGENAEPDADPETGDTKAGSGADAQGDANVDAKDEQP